MTQLKVLSVFCKNLCICKIRSIHLHDKKFNLLSLSCKIGSKENMCVGKTLFKHYSVFVISVIQEAETKHLYFRLLINLSINKCTKCKLIMFRCVRLYLSNLHLKHVLPKKKKKIYLLSQNFLIFKLSKHHSISSNDHFHRKQNHLQTVLLSRGAAQVVRSSSFFFLNNFSCTEKVEEKNQVNKEHRPIWPSFNKQNQMTNMARNSEGGAKRREKE